MSVKRSVSNRLMWVYLVYAVCVLWCGHSNNLLI